MSRSVGRVEPVFVTTVRVVWFQGRSSTDRSHSTSRPMGTFSSAVHGRLAMSSSICEAVQLTKNTLPAEMALSLASRDKANPLLHADQSNSRTGFGTLSIGALAIRRNGNYASSIRDPESHLLVAFHHRFRRFQKTEHGRRDRFLSSSAKLDLGLVEGVQDTSWILELERAITVQQMLNSASFVKTAWTTRSQRAPTGEPGLPLSIMLWSFFATTDTSSILPFHS